MSGRISVTLITRNRPQFFIGCLSSLLSQSYTEWDLVIIDGSKPPLRSNQAVYFLLKVVHDNGHSLQMINDQSLGICQAWQKGLELSSPDCEFGQRLEDDIWLHPDYLKHLHDIIITDEKIGAVGGLSPNAWNFSTIKAEEFKNYFYSWNGLIIPDDRQCCFIENPPEIYEVSHLHGLFLYRKRIVQEVGGFGTHMTRVGHRDETDLTLRMYFADYRLLVCPKAWLRHAEAMGGGSRDALTVEERTELQMEDEARFQKRLHDWREKYPEKPFPIEAR